MLWRKGIVIYNKGILFKSLINSRKVFWKKLYLRLDLKNELEWIKNNEGNYFRFWSFENKEKMLMWVSRESEGEIVEGEIGVR